jgi:hypothetical protein
MQRTGRAWYQRKSSRRRGHTLTIPTEDMLWNLFRDACQHYCLENCPWEESLPVSEREKLRKQWTAEALKVDEAPSWTALKNEDVDLLKPYLRLLADPANEEKQAAYANAAEDGRRRRVVEKILENAKVIRMLQWLVKRDRWLLTAASINGYVESICKDQRASGNWRELLLPFLEEHIVITIEERKRQHLRDAQEARTILLDHGRIFVCGTEPLTELVDYALMQAPPTMDRGFSVAGRSLNAMDGVPF